MFRKTPTRILKKYKSFLRLSTDRKDKFLKAEIVERKDESGIFRPVIDFREYVVTTKKAFLGPGIWFKVDEIDQAIEILQDAKKEILKRGSHSRDRSKDTGNNSKQGPLL